jgi:hypothetical protein
VHASGSGRLSSSPAGKDDSGGGYAEYLGVIDVAVGGRGSQLKTFCADGKRARFRLRAAVVESAGIGF